MTDKRFKRSTGNFETVEELDATIFSMHEDGYSGYEIANVCGIKPHAVHRLIRDKEAAEKKEAEAAEKRRLTNKLNRLWKSANDNTNA